MTIHSDLLEIPRDRYLNQLIKWEWCGMVKIITGVRRCGKSYLLFNIFKNYLLRKGVSEENIIEAHMEVASFKKYRDAEKLIQYILEKTCDKKDQYYVFIDEIQFVPDFESVLNDLLTHRNIDVYVTGSNAKSLSSDIVTEFRGRSVEVRVWPLSFSEFFGVYQGSKYDAWKEYMLHGGLPEVAKIKDSEEKARYLKNTVRTVYLRDIVERNNVRLQDSLGSIMDYLSSTIGSMTNPLRITDSLIQKDNDIDKNTVSKYIDHLINAFLFESTSRYDIKGKQYMNHLSKYYACDIGIRNARIEFRQNDDFGHIMENVVYNELRHRGFDVHVGIINHRRSGEIHIDPGYEHSLTQTKTTFVQYEIDFIAERENRRYYIQSAYRMDDRDKIEAETMPLNLARDNFKKIVIIGEDVPPHVDDKGINYIGIYDFLLDPQSLEKL